MCAHASKWLLLDFPVIMSNHVTKEHIDRVMIEGMVRFLLPVLELVPGLWTFMRAHVNNFYGMESVG